MQAIYVGITRLVTLTMVSTEKLRVDVFQASLYEP